MKILIFLNSLKDHLQDVDKLLSELDGSNIKVSLIKRSLCKEEVLLLVHIGSKTGISLNLKKFEANFEYWTAS